jgi:hypothetical protein
LDARKLLALKIFVGLALLVLGASLFLLLFFGATRTDTVIEASFVLQPGEIYGPYMNGTYYHTRVIANSVLMGEVLVEGEGINVTANGFNTQNLRNVFINQNYSFTIDPADDLYTFTFNNAGKNIQSAIQFTLRERWTNVYSLIAAFTIPILTIPAGSALIIMSIRKQSSTTINRQTQINDESTFKKSVLYRNEPVCS